ncbi:conserved hypothetical protein [Leishmania mexicana MHOM/GT/2001/U1103]|uniref:Uncharacterized protein n=1 Tax=Leishmania mexicana (strain MHOM/GT/2001/U1103) TaxID=929439 RepID=E9ARN0_LEIMU|nr:conserved hypothetical protein [Leishmania mexicana MHOM/GT/2001/U1103]CBZ25601.1 conserved hypothetical protein [Leishmania mexicana MHOM/GT/2001/U1103]
MESTDQPAASQPAAAGAAATATTSPSPEVYFKKQVLKLGLDGTSLSRLVVVTNTHIYVCVPSGGITRAIAVRRIERVTLCPREDIGDDEDGGDHAGWNAALDSTAAAGGAGSDDRTMPSADPHREKSKSFFASVFSLRGDIAGRVNPQGPHNSHPDSARSSADASPAASSRQRFSSAADKAEREVPASLAVLRWVTIVTLGIAHEASLALQFYSAVDGEDFVAALRKASHISTAAVFNLPKEEGPIDAAGRLLSLPARCENPTVPRVLKREAGDTNMGNHKPDTESRHAVEEVQLSPPRSPRSPTAPSQPAAHPALPSHNRSSIGNRDGSRGRRSSSRENVHTAVPGQAAQEGIGDLAPPAPSTAVYAPPVEETLWRSPPQAVSRLQTSMDGSPLEWRTPSPLRTAPHRKVPAPPRSPPAPSQQLELSAPPPLKIIQGPAIEGRGGGGSRKRGSNATQSLRDAASERTRTTSQERLSRLIYATAASSATREEVPSYPEAAAPVAAQQTSQGPWPRRRDGPRAAPASRTKAEAIPRRSLFADELNTTQVVDPTASPLSAPAPRTASMVTEDGARDVPIHADALQAELEAQSATVARLQRSLQAHESLLIELADARADVRGLQVTLAERNDQCDEWRAACSQAEQRVSMLRRQQEGMLAEQQERLWRAHHAELEAVQAAFEEYDARMSAFLEQLQQDHREEAVQWQRERRTLLLQLHEQQRQQQAMRDVNEHRRVRAAEVAAQAHYEAQRRCVPAPQVYQRESAHAQRQRQSSAVVAGVVHSPRDSGTSSWRRPLASSAECNPASAAWPRADVDDEVNHGHPAARHDTAAVTRHPHSYFRAHLQTPPSYPRAGSVPDAHDVGNGVYTPSRRSYV